MSREAPVVFCSSVGGGVFGEHLGAALAATGTAVHLDYLVPVADYWVEKSRGSPWWLRFRTYVLYPLRLLVRATVGPRRRYIVTSNPFFAPLLVALAAKVRRHQVIHLVYDLYPDALLVSGFTQRTSVVARVCAWVTRVSFRHCQATVFLGSHLAGHAERTYGPVRNATVIPVGSDSRLFLDARPAAEADSVTMLYAGHLGRMHDYQTLGDFLRYPAGGEVGTKVRVVFRANGPGMEALRRLVEEARRALNGDNLPAVEFGPTLPEAEWAQFMRSAQVGLVTMAPGAERVVMPSKTYSAMMAGQAILAVCPGQSDLAETIRRHDCGWIVQPGASDQLREMVKEIAGNPRELLRKRQNAYDAAHRWYSHEAVARQWHTLLRNVTRDDTLAA